MDESYDHIIRDANELAAFRRYVGDSLAKPVSRRRNTRLNFEMC
jgi:hypothetical protein